MAAVVFPVAEDNDNRNQPIIMLGRGGPARRLARTVRSLAFTSVLQALVLSLWERQMVLVVGLVP